MWKFIVFDDLISNYPNSLTLRQLFGEVLTLRFRGYRKYYGTGSVPQDCYDFIGTHLIIAREINNLLIPQLCLRSVSSQQASLYNKNFPFLEHMFAGQENTLSKSCKEFIENQNNICYTNNYTIDPDLNDKDKQELAEMILGFYYLYHTEKNISTFITAASDRFKVYKTRIKQGYSYLKDDSDFSTFSAGHIMDEKFRAMIMTKFSKESEALADKYSSFYESKIDLTTKAKQTMTKLKIAA